MAKMLLGCVLAMSLAACGGKGGAADVGGAGDSGAPDGDVAAEAIDAVDAVDAADVPGEEGLPLQQAIVRAGKAALAVDAAKLTMTLTFDGADRVVLPADAFRLGRVDTVDDATSYDPWPMVTNDPLYQVPAGLAWVAPAAMTIDSASDSSAILTLDYGGGRLARVSVGAGQDGAFGLTWIPVADSGVDVAWFRVGAQVGATEAFYGLGAWLDGAEHRGKVRAMQIEIATDMESGYNDAHVPVPLVVGTRGWGLFVEDSHPAIFDVAAAAPDRVEAIFGNGKDSPAGLIVHLFAAERPLDVTGLYYGVTGAPLLPARWALGPWIWRDEIAGQIAVEKDLDTIRSLHLATTAYWIDRPYASGVESFDFKPSDYADPVAMVKKAHDQGFRLAVWHAPYLDRDDPSVKTLRDEAVSKGYFPPLPGPLFNKWNSSPFDFTNPDAWKWWQQHVAAYKDLGIEGYKLDYGEDIVAGLWGVRNNWGFFDGSDERTMHRVFKLLYHKMYAEMVPADGGFLLCRAGTWGDQKNVSVIWPGDLDARFWRYGDKVKDNDGTDLVAVGGLPASVAYGVGLGPSGFPFFGADTGGYRHAPPNKELFTRWFEQTALSSVMQVGTDSSDVAGEPTAANGFDAEMLGWYGTYTKLHLRLWPYEWTYAQNLAVDGRPIQRPLGLAYPDLGAHPSDTYMFGDWLLVAPVVDEGATTRKITFPPGKWVDWWTGEVIQGGAEKTVDAPLSKLPLYLAEGGIVPMLRPTIEAMAPVADPSKVDSYASTPGVLWVRVFPGPDSTFKLFDGGQVSQSQAAAGNITVTTSGPGKEFGEGAVIEIVACGARPAKVILDGAEAADLGSVDAVAASAAGWAFVADVGGSVFVRVPAGEHTVRMEP